MNLPLNEDAENCLIGSFMASPQAVGCLMAERGVTADSFHHPGNRIISTVMLDSWRDGVAIDPFVLIATLKQRGLFEDAGGFDVLPKVTSVPTGANASQYLELVAETDQLRKIAILCHQKGQEAQTPGASPGGILTAIGEGITAMSSGGVKAVKSMKQHIFEKMERVQNGEESKSIISTGIEKLDRNSPLKRGDMPLISGERKAGKSIFSINIAVNVALSGLPVLYFSLEDRAEKVVDRMFAKVSKIPIVAHSVIAISEWQIQAMQSAAVKLAEAKLIIRDDVFDLMGMIAVIRQTKIKHPELPLAVIDYGQLVRVQLAKGASREQEVATISRTFRLLAMELDIAILLLCQLNKEGDTRESKALEQDCTAMWKVTHANPEDSGKRIIVIPFQRNGDSSIAFPVAFLGATARIEAFHDEV